MMELDRELVKNSNIDINYQAVSLIFAGNVVWNLRIVSSQISTLRRQGRTLFSTVPDTAGKEPHSLFVQEVKLTCTWT